MIEGEYDECSAIAVLRREQLSEYTISRFLLNKEGLCPDQSSLGS